MPHWVTLLFLNRASRRKKEKEIDMYKRKEFKIGNRTFMMESGKIAKQANGSVLLTCGDTVVLATATMSKTPRPDIDFFPLTVEYVEKFYAAGKIPGGFFKREARPSMNATLAARLVDRPIRPKFPKDFINDVQIALTVLSYDPTFAPEFMGIIAASAALEVSDIPFHGPVAGVLVGRVDGQLIVNPSNAEAEKSDLSLIVAGTDDAILMVECEAKEVSEAVVVDAIMFAHGHIKEAIAAQRDFASDLRKPKVAHEPKSENQELKDAITGFIGARIADGMTRGNKKDIEDLLSTIETQVKAHFDPALYAPEQVAWHFNKIKKDQIRKSIIARRLRPDGRALDEVRKIDVEVGLLPSAHGSALFTRGETQSLCVTTLGTSLDEQIIDGLDETSRKTYYFHYNFPPYSVGEVGNMARTSRRELGHGALAEKALRGVLPDQATFPYTIRIVSEIMESNGSSSMASVCGGALSLMDCGVPISAPVSGIAMGLLMDQDGYVILTDIQGLEDHYGDMDFKVAGTAKGITALQLDIKVSGLSKEILQEALRQALDGRMHVLAEMNKVLDKPRPEVAPNAPIIVFFTIDPEKIGLVIGPGGKTIRRIEEDTHTTVVIADGNQGEVCISGSNQAAIDAAREIIDGLVREVKVGEVYDGRVAKIATFGAFVEILPDKMGLIHISKLSDRRIDRVEDVVNLGDTVRVKVAQIDAQRRINLVPASREEHD